MPRGACSQSRLTQVCSTPAARASLSWGPPRRRRLCGRAPGFAYLLGSTLACSPPSGDLFRGRDVSPRRPALPGALLETAALRPSPRRRPDRVARLDRSPFRQPNRRACVRDSPRRHHLSRAGLGRPLGAGAASTARRTKAPRSPAALRRCGGTTPSSAPADIVTRRGIAPSPSIAEAGLLFSGFRSHRIARENFPIRNRIIAAGARTLVVEAAPLGLLSPRAWPWSRTRRLRDPVIVTRRMPRLPSLLSRAPSSSQRNRHPRGVSPCPPTAARRRRPVRPSPGAAVRPIRARRVGFDPSASTPSSRAPHGASGSRRACCRRLAPGGAAAVRCSTGGPRLGSMPRSSAAPCRKESLGMCFMFAVLVYLYETLAPRCLSQARALTRSSARSLRNRDR